MDQLIATLASSLGVVGALVWYLYYTTSKTLPGIVKEHRESIAEVTNKFSDTLRDEREHRTREMQQLQQFIKSGEGCKYTRPVQ
jgi:hypothetical protein